MKKLQAFLAAVLLAAASISSLSSSSYYSPEIDIDLDNLPKDVFVYDNWLCAPSWNGVALIGVVDMTVTSITVPAEINGLPVVDLINGSSAGYGIDRDINSCQNLKEILVDEDNPYFEVVDGALISKTFKEICAFPSAYEQEVYTVPNGRYTLLHNVFDYCRNLKELTFPESLAERGTSSTDIYYCNALEKLNILGLTDYTNVKECPNLKEINLKNPDSIVECTMRFVGLKSLETLSVPENCKIDYEFVALNCPELREISLPGRMSANADITVQHCDSLESLDLSKINRTERGIYDYQNAKLTVSDCAELQELKLTDANYYTITNCPKLTSLAIDTNEHINSIQLQIENSNLQDLYFYSTDSCFYNLMITDCPYIPGQEYEAYYSAFADMGITVHCRRDDTSTQDTCEEYNIPYVIIEDEITPGDVCGDGELDLTDVVMLNRITVGVEKVTPSRLLAGDVDGSGKLELTDSMRLLRRLIGLED